MKPFIIALLCICKLTCFGQNNLQDSIHKYLPLTIDRVTGEKHHNAKPIFARSANGSLLEIQLSCSPDEKNYFISLKSKNIGCSEENAYLRILYINEEREIWKNAMSYNCKDMQMVSVVPDAGDNLVYQTSASSITNSDKVNIEIIRLTTSSGYHDFKISKTAASVLKNQFKFIKLLTSVKSTKE